MRLQISLPIATAHSSSCPLRPLASATASAAGTIEALGCRTDGRWVSSKSSVWASVPLIIAADDGRQPLAPEERGRFGGAALGLHHAYYRLVGGTGIVHAGRGQAVTRDVDDPVASVTENLLRQAGYRDGGELGEHGCMRSRRNAHWTIASGRTGAPVAPVIRSGLRTKMNSLTRGIGQAP